MRVTLVDDSVPFDGETPALMPLGGVEKAFAYLAGALVRCGHQVQVFNRCAEPKCVDGAAWQGWDGARPPDTDVLIAYRKPSLLDFVATAQHRVLWVAGLGGYLAKARNRARLDSHRPQLVFLTRSHLESWDNTDDVRAIIVNPGIGPAYLADERPAPAEPSHALVTSNPLHGLDWLLDLWVDRIHPISSTAELHIYSAALEKALRDEPVAEAYRQLVVRVRAATEKGVVVKRPLADPAMAVAYRAARAHLYPGGSAETYAYTLAESQACGLPAVGRPREPVRERVIHGATGYLHDDADAFANATLRLLNDTDSYRRLSNQAVTMQRGHGWDEVAAEFEAHWT